MRVLLILAAAAVLAAQGDPAAEAYRAWDATQRGVDSRTRKQHLLDVSAEWVAKWPESQFAWHQRRAALVATPSASAEVWKQVDENILRLSQPHTFASMAAYDWVTAGVNLEEAEILLLDELAWEDSRPKPAPGSNTLADLVDEAGFTVRPFDMLCSLARAQILLKQYDEARTTIERVHGWLDGDFQRYFDTDPLEAFPDHGAKYFQLSAELARAEGRKADALAFYHGYLANPYFLREYSPAADTGLLGSLWKDIGGTGTGWAAYNSVPPLPPGVPAGRTGVPYLPWVKLDYKLPPMQVADLEGRTWTNRDFAGKTTIVYLWASSCPPCSPNLGALQTLSERVKNRGDVQVVTLSVDQERDKLVAFMKQKDYTFPVLASRPYVQTVLPQFLLGQLWIVDGTGNVRLQRTNNNFAGAEEALVQELMYKAGHLSPAGPSLSPGSPRRAIEEAVKAAYRREFGLAIEYPAIYNNPKPADCVGNRHPPFTTTAYLTTDRITTLYTMYMAQDGSVVRETRLPVALAPAGKIRVLVVLVRYPETFPADALAKWEAAQRQINEDHAVFARSRGYKAPIVVFDNTNIMVERGQIDNPHDPASVRAAAEHRGFPTAGYNIVMAIDINPDEAAGGLSLLAERSIYVGNYGRWRTPLDEKQWRMVASTAYHHEMAHHWGWPGTHDWRVSCGGGTPEYAPFIVPPVLFGWEDLHGDHMPEILSETPYGRRR